MKTKIIIFYLPIILLAFLHCSRVKMENELTIIPQPTKVEHKSGSFEINGDTKLLFYPKENEELKSIADWFSEFADLRIQTGSKKNS